eukprot:CAMPEP_0181405246 /NCGR_PEP_ID=MMETSP1110-20121109/4662_1 /TAXON_ID=174948 /ORGANISM="Symbiodinium sp., Strain CCMP421" /LENGTH=125 /DNA_ID=CAMNT_0023527631 /DNA_START=407 /DNA_END=784 /DNA_ORIENTATION=+
MGCPSNSILVYSNAVACCQIQLVGKGCHDHPTEIAGNARPVHDPFPKRLQRNRVDIDIDREEEYQVQNDDQQRLAKLQVGVERQPKRIKQECDDQAPTNRKACEATRFRQRLLCTLTGAKLGYYE